LEIRDIVFERQKPLAVVYKGIALGCGYSSCVGWVKRSEPIIIVALGALCFTQPIILADLKLGILINFNVPILKEGIKRIVNNPCPTDGRRV
jgi:hypothetical protein